MSCEGRRTNLSFIHSSFFFALIEVNVYYPPEWDFHAKWKTAREDKIFLRFFFLHPQLFCGVYFPYPLMFNSVHAVAATINFTLNKYCITCEMGMVWRKISKRMRKYEKKKIFSGSLVRAMSFFKDWQLYKYFNVLVKFLLKYLQFSLCLKDSKDFL